MTITHRSGLPLGILLAASLAAFTGCAGTPSDTTASSQATATDSVTISDAWIKAADTGMTGGFGTLHNDADQAITVLSASSDVSSMMELHETVMSDAGSMVMRSKEGGFEIPPHGEFVLEPGGNHIMFMNLDAPLVPGDEITVTLKLSNDSSYTYTAPVKDFSGANENYVDGATPTPTMGEMSH